jgi:predicted PP-loop superfamily ATPase
LIFWKEYKRYLENSIRGGSIIFLQGIGGINVKKMKTALEIALEKTKSLEKEKEGLDELENQKYIRAALSLGRSFLENKVEKESVLEGFSKYPGKSRPAVLNAFVKEMLDKFSLGNTPKILEVITLLSNDERVLQACEEAKRIYQQYQHEFNKKAASMRKTIHDSLQQKYTAAGISGSAIAGFNVKQLGHWEKVAAEAEREYRQAQQSFYQVLLG